MTLPSVLVAAAIGAIVMAALVNSLQNVQKGQAGVRNAMDFDLFRQNVYTMLKTQQNCGAGFWSTGGTTKLAIPSNFTSGTKIPVPVLKLGGSTLLDMASPKISDGIRAQSVELESNSAPTVETVGGVSYNAYEATLRIRAQRVGEGYGRPVFEQSFPMRLYSNPAAGGALERCTSTADIVADETPDGEANWPLSKAVCPAGTFMIGADSGGPICGLPGGQIHLGMMDDLPAGADPLNCITGKRTYACENTTKTRCAYTNVVAKTGGGNLKSWKVEFIRKDGTVKKELDCKGGLIAELPEPGSIVVQPDSLVPDSVNQDDYDIICKTRNSFQNSCSVAMKDKVKKLPKDAQAGECYNVDESWVYVKETKTKGENEAATEKCTKGLLLEPL